MPRAHIPATFYRADSYCTENSVGYLMRRVVMAISQATDERLDPQGITNAQWAPLFMLRRCRASTVAELARELQSDPGATTRLLDRLEAKGLCRRQRSTDDRRVVNIELTAEGERAADKIPVALAAVLNDHLAGFTKAECQMLQSLLRRMLDNADAVKAAVKAALPAGIINNRSVR